MPITDLIPTVEVASLLDRDVRTIHRMVARGEIEWVIKAPGEKGAYLFSPDEIERVRKILRASA